MRARRFVLAGVAALCVLVVAPAARAKSYDIARLRSTITIETDGSFTVSEQRSYAFSGSFHSAFLQIPPGAYRIEQIAVREGDRSFERAPVGLERRGTYEARTGPD